MLNKNPFGVVKFMKTGHEVQCAKHVYENFCQNGPTSSPSVSMMQASNVKTSNIKFVDIFKKNNWGLNFALFGFFMRKVWALEVGLFHISMALVQRDL